MKATMKEVAELAGVGLGTVSRVVNGIKVKEATYQKVQAAIEALQYQPDEYARGLKINKSNVIALIIPTIWHPFFAEFAYHVEKELSKRHYKLFICNAEENGQKEFEYLQMLEKNKVDGIIGITYSDIDQYVSSNLPFVSIDRHFSENIPYVTADNYSGGKLAAQMLLEKSAQNFAYIGGTNRYENETNFRKAGFYDALREAGFSVKKLDMLEPIEDLEGKIRAFLLDNPEIDGIFTVNDFMAMNVMKVSRSIGRFAPKDYQIIGFDGLKSASDQSYFLSTIAQPIEKMAQAAVGLLMDVMDEKVEESRIVLPVCFEDGGTTK